MAHFAEINETNTVVRIVAISNDDILDENGFEQEQLGIDLCLQHVGAGEWVQTSYNNNFRKCFGRIGFVYARDADVFYDPVGPYPSWSLDKNYDWQPPTPYPEDGQDYLWDENTQEWIIVEESSNAPATDVVVLP